MGSLNQTITRWQGVGLMATTLLGTGVFILPQLTIDSAGDLAVWTWVLLVLAILPLAWVFAELGRRFSHAGGPAFFVQEAFGVCYGHMVGLMFLCVVPLGAPAALMMTFEFLKPLITLSPLQSIIAQVSVIGVLFLLNLRGLQLSGKAQLLLTVVILAVVAAMLLALFFSEVTPVEPVASGNLNGAMGAVALAIWSFLGIEAVTHLSAEFKDVKKDFVPAVMIGIVLVGGIYILCTYLSLLAPNAELSMVDAFSLLLGPYGNWIIPVLGVASGLATVNVYFASAARLAWVLSKDGILPSQLTTLNQHGVPRNALMAVQCVAVSIMVGAYLMSQPFEAMVRWTNGVFVFIYAASMLSAWRLLPTKHRPMIMLGLVVCVIFAACLGLSMLYGGALALVLLAWLLVRPANVKVAV